MSNTLTERIFLPDASAVTLQIVNFAASMIEIESDDPAVKQAPRGWALVNLFRYGMIGFYDSESPALRGWWIAMGADRFNRYKQPIRCECRTDRTGAASMFKTIEYDPKKRGMKLLRANPLTVPPLIAMQEDAGRIERAYSLLDVNLRAAKRTQILTCEKNQKDAVLDILADQDDGEFSVIDRSALSEIGSLDISVPYVGGDVHALISNLWADALRRWGGVTPPQYKAERTQSAEVAASVAESIDNIYIMLDTLNADAKRVGVPVRFKYRGYGATFDQDPADTVEDNENAENTKQNPAEEVPTDA